MNIIAVLLIFLAACVPMQFENAGSKNRLQDDQYDCRVILGYAGSPRIDDSSKELANIMVNARDEMQQCLGRKGWRSVS